MEKQTEISRVLDALDKPATIGQLSERLSMNVGSVSRALKKLMEQGLIHISGWLPTTVRGGRPTGIYSRGKGIAPPRPTLSAAAEAALGVLPATSAQIRQKLGVSRSRANALLQELAGKVHIGGWLERPGIRPAAIYSPGSGADVKYIPTVRRVAPAPRASSPLYRTHWAGMESCRMSRRIVA